VTPYVRLPLVKTPLPTRALWVGVAASILLVLYSFTGVLQPAMLYVGERAQLNAAFWGSVFLLALVTLIACGIALWRRYML
jgi:uncharacterized membrane protein